MRYAMSNTNRYEELRLMRVLLANAQYQDQIAFFTHVITEIEEEIAENIDEIEQNTLENRAKHHISV